MTAHAMSAHWRRESSAGALETAVNLCSALPATDVLTKGRRPTLESTAVAFPLDRRLLALPAASARTVELVGRFLDVGCGNKPNQHWFWQVSEYVGLDVLPGSEVDVLVSSEEA